jgi:phosphoglycolate phosphatase
MFLDFDGPIIDVSEKYYRVYADILARHKVPVLSKEEYWQAKREKTPDDVILKHTEAFPVENYHQERKGLIETDYYLAYDRLQDGVVEVLNRLFGKYELILVTLRTSPDQLRKELQYFNLEKYFTAVLTSPAERSPRWAIKVSLIKDCLDGKTLDNGVVIGDTETDILAGRELGFTTIAVLNGIRTHEILSETNPTFLVRSIIELRDLFSQNRLFELLISPPNIY